MGFTKLDSRIVDSSIWEESSNVLKVFISFWTKSDSSGIVNATFNALYRSANLCDDNKNPLPIENFELALNVLMSPDKNSRSSKEEGKRILRLEESKWLIVNYADYREHTYSDNPEAIKKRNQRKGDIQGRVPFCPGHSASASASSSVSEKGEEIQEKRKKFVPPTEQEVIAYFKENSYPESLAKRFFNGYSVAGWKDSQGNQIKVWKQKAQQVWFKDSEKIQTQTHSTVQCRTGWVPPQAVLDQRQQNG